MLRTAEWWLAINHPWGAEQRTKPRGEGLGIPQYGEGSVEVEFVLGVQRSEAFHELAAKHFLEHLHW